MSTLGLTDNDPYVLNPYALGAFVSDMFRTEAGPARTEVDCRLDPGIVNKIILLVGQSGSISCVNSPFTPVNPTVHSLDFTRGKVTRVTNILMGDGYSLAIDPNTQSSPFSRVADTMVTRAWCGRPILGPFGVSSSTYAQWADGGAIPPVFGGRGYLRHRFGVMGQRLRDKGYVPDLILWAQGVADATLGTSTNDCVADMQSMIAAMRGQGWTCPIWMSKETWAFGSAQAGGPAVLAAQDIVVANDPTIHIGPNQNLLDDTYRYDQCHWNNTGSIAAAAAWVTALGV